MSHWLATLTLTEMFFLAFAVILAMAAAYYLIPLMRARKERAEAEPYDPRWMDYQKWVKTNY